MQGARVVADLLEFCAEFVDILLRVAEDDRQLRVLHIKQPGKRLDLLIMADL